MAHCSQEELSALLKDASVKVEVGARYIHFKDSAKTYVVASLAILESSEEVAVVYTGEYGDRVSFVRPLSSWLAEVAWEGKSVPRFQKI